MKSPLGKPLTSIISEKWELRNCTLVQESLFFRSGGAIQVVFRGPASRHSGPGRPRNPFSFFPLALKIPFDFYRAMLR